MEFYFGFKKLKNKDISEIKNLKLDHERKEFLLNIIVEYLA